MILIFGSSEWKTEPGLKLYAKKIIFLKEKIFPKLFLWALNALAATKIFLKETL